MTYENSIFSALAFRRSGATGRIHFLFVAIILMIVVCASTANAQKTLCQEGTCVRIDSISATGSTIRARVSFVSDSIKPHATHYNVTIEGGPLIEINNADHFLFNLHRGQRKFTIQACFRGCITCRSTCTPIARFSDELAPPPPPRPPASSSTAPPPVGPKGPPIKKLGKITTATAKNDVDVYEGPGGNFKIVGMMRKGNAATVVARHPDGWLNLKLGVIGGVGWVAADHLTVTERRR